MAFPNDTVLDVLRDNTSANGGTGYIRTGDFGFEASKGTIPGLTVVSKSGSNPDVDSAGNEDIWRTGGNWVAPTTNRTMSVVSSSASDAAAGTGARTLTLSGLNSSYADISETITLNGTTPVVSSNSYVMLNNTLVATAGSSTTNVGVITITASVDATVEAPLMVLQKGIIKLHVDLCGNNNNVVAGRFELLLKAN